jgi:hypothetical protein
MSSPFAYQLDTPTGVQVVVSLLEPEWIEQHDLHPWAVMGTVRADVDPALVEPVDLTENGGFLRVLSRAIYEHGSSCGFLQREAEIQGEGHIYLLDGRTREPAGRVPPADILGTFTVSGGKLVTGSYQHNPRHRLLTADGWFRLPAELESALVAALRSLAAG